jgi:hypothetical protein
MLLCHSTSVTAAAAVAAVLSLQERFYFGDGVLPLFESGIPLLLDRLKRLPDREKVSKHT